MGILTDPANAQSKIRMRHLLTTFKTPICVLFYVAGIVYFCSLADSSRNNPTYFSENALLPGLVYSEIRTDTANYALNMVDEFERERESHRNNMATAWILAKFRQIGLETHSHNFTLHYPLDGGRVFTGKNVYGILRAPRIGSTESIVISTPYRTPDSIHPDVTHSIPILLAFANFARKQKYWAKDIIFVVTDQEQLGMQAWLEAYHGSDVCNAMHVLDCGTLHARAGSIQAAINLEFSSFDLSYIDVKIEGLNGQLPNLDLVNLIQRLAMKEGIVSGHKQTNDRKRSGAKSTWAQNFHHMISMVLTQSSGVPNGNHGLFFRYGIQAVTLEGHKREQTNYQRKAQGATAILKLVEGIARSVNNLLERFHQSFFFYLLVASDRYVSIGDYMPSLGLMAAALLIKAFIVWLKVNQKTSRAEAGDSDCSTSTVKECDTLQNYSFISVGRFIIVAHAFGVLAAYLPFATPLTEIFHQYGIKTEVYLFASLWILSVIGSMVSLLMSFNKENIEILHIAALLETGTALIILGVLNFSLGLLLAVFVVPFGILVQPNGNRFTRRFGQIVCLLYTPIVFIYLMVLTLTWYSFQELSFLAIAHRAILAAMEAVAFSVVDSIIYGNWLYPLVTLVFFPIWIMFFSILCIRPVQAKVKTN